MQSYVCWEAIACLDAELPRPTRACNVRLRAAEGSLGQLPALGHRIRLPHLPRPLQVLPAILGRQHR